MITVKNKNGIFLLEQDEIISESSNHIKINMSNRIVIEEDSLFAYREHRDIEDHSAKFVRRIPYLKKYICYIRPLQIWCKKHLKLVNTIDYEPYCCKKDWEVME